MNHELDLNTSSEIAIEEGIGFLSSAEMLHITGLHNYLTILD